MMSPSTMWLALGALVGAMHAGALWRSVARPLHAGWSAPLRLLLVAAVLVFAAIAGQLTAAAAGWATGLVVAGAVCYGRRAA
jgi:hypothetical protein